MKIKFYNGNGADKVIVWRHSDGTITLDIPTINEIEIKLEEYEQLIDLKNDKSVVGIVINKQNSE